MGCIFKKRRGIYAAHFHYTHLSDSLCLNKPGAITFLLANTWSCSFKDKSAAQSVFVHFLPRNLSLHVCLWTSIWMTPSVLTSLKLQACTWAFCKGKPFVLSTRHRLTVAGNFLFPPYVFFFSATKLLHKVCLKTNIVLSGIERKKHLLYNELY